MLKYSLKKKSSFKCTFSAYCDYFHKFRQAGFLRHWASMPLQDWSESLKYHFHCTTSPHPMHSYSTSARTALHVAFQIPSPTCPYSPPFPISTPMSLVSSKISAMASGGSRSLLAYTWIWERRSVAFRRTISGMLLEQTSFDWKKSGVFSSTDLVHTLKSTEIWLKCTLCGCLEEFPV